MGFFSAKSASGNSQRTPLSGGRFKTVIHTIMPFEFRFLIGAQKRLCFLRPLSKGRPHGKERAFVKGRALWNVALLGASLALSNCTYRKSTVKIPAADETPPFAALDVVGAGRTLVLAVGQEPETVDLPAMDSLVFIALAEDRDGGVKDLALSGNAMVTCKDVKTGKTTLRSTGFLRRTVMGSAPRKRGPVNKSARFVLRPRDLQALCRGPGLAFAGAVGQASARTSNFNEGHAASPRVEFRLAGVPETEVSSSAIVTPDIPKPVGFQPDRGLGGTGSCPASAAPGSPAAEPSAETEPGTAPKCIDGPVPFVSPHPGAGAPATAPPERVKNPS
jgi:hypothetical protein